jgi:hypothetical protein
MIFMNLLIMIFMNLLIMGDFYIHFPNQLAKYLLLVTKFVLLR